MLITPNPGSGPASSRRKQRRPLNVAGIKKAIVFLAGLVTAFVSAITGLGAHAAFGPMLSWMLGFAPEKAQATAVRFACMAAAAGSLGAYIKHAAPEAFWLRGLALFVGAVVGAMIGVPISRRTQTVNWRRWFLSVGVALALLVVMRTGKLSSFDIIYVAQWKTVPLLMLLGLIVGAVTQAMGLPSGLLMVPGLYFVGAFTPSESISLSLLVIALAALLPAINYARQGVIDRVYSVPVLLAALAGGLGGGMLLPPDHDHMYFPHRILIVFSAAIAMFLCARELARIAMSSAVPPPGNTIKPDL